MKVVLHEGAFSPTRAHMTDAGLDVYSPKNVVVPVNGSAVIKTGVCIELPQNTAGLFVSKSGLNIKDGILSTGLIDEGYQGEIVVKLYNFGDHPKVIGRGDKISQLVVIPVLYVDVEQVSSFDRLTERGTDGFGSTGK